MPRRFCALTLLLITAPVALAQKALPHGEPSSALRPLTAQEGLDIADSAAGQDSETGRRTDCSHLVHELYLLAGFPYPYASSLDLYHGWEKFVRVRAPQPGDLVVWPGHVGIVLNPKQHSFFSSVRSGARTELYDSRYWRARGRPRFYRYLTQAAATEGGQAGPQIESKTEAAAAPAAGNRREYSPPAPTRSGPGMQPVSAPSATVSAGRSEPAPAGASRSAIASASVPRLSQGVPGMQDVAEALADMNGAAGEILRAGNLAQLKRPVIVYRELQVTRVEIKGKRGTARVEIESLALLAGERMESRWRADELLQELRRTKKGWVTTASKGSVYVPREVALRILAARLAALTQDEKASPEREREQAQIIRFLNLLVVQD